MAMTDDLWWQRGILYQVYPRSFQDSNDDGIGDLQGIITRLPYLKTLGIHAVWLSPIFPSPMADFGYDVSDYTGIDRIFGDAADFDALIQAAHGYGMKLILDLVPNHTSDQHPWFVESRRSRDNQSATGISGAMARLAEGRRTTGFRSSAAAPGNSMKPADNITITRSLRSSRT
jgi:alpha-glucosidase